MVLNYSASIVRKPGVWKIRYGDNMVGNGETEGAGAVIPSRQTLGGRRKWRIGTQKHICVEISNGT